MKEKDEEINKKPKEKRSRSNEMIEN